MTDYEVYDLRPSDSDLLIGALEAHQARLGRTPRLVAADAAFYSAKKGVAAKAKAKASSASGPPFLAVTGPALLLFAFALRALGGAIGKMEGRISVVMPSRPPPLLT